MTTRLIECAGMFPVAGIWIGICTCCRPGAAPLTRSGSPLPAASNVLVWVLASGAPGVTVGVTSGAEFSLPGERLQLKLMRKG